MKKGTRVQWELSVAAKRTGVVLEYDPEPPEDLMCFKDYAFVIADDPSGILPVVCIPASRLKVVNPSERSTSQPELPFNGQAPHETI